MVLSRHVWWVVLCASAAGCAGASAESAQQDTDTRATLRERPRRGTARRVLREAAARARECLPITVDRAEVSGAFQGASGRYLVESVLGENIGREQRACIREAFEGVRVQPFRAERYELSQVVTRNAEGSSESSSEASSSGGEAANSNSGSASVTAATTNGSAASTTATTASTTTTTGTAASVNTATAATSGATGASGTGATSNANTTGAQTSSATTGTTEPSNSLERQAVENIMRTRVTVVRACYQNQLARDPQLRARIRVRYVVDAAGLVTSASSTAVAEAGDPERVTDLARCLEGVIRGTTFPARPGGTPAELSTPFTFAPGQSASTTVATAGADNAATSAASPSGTSGTSSAPIETPGQIDRARVTATLRARMPTLSACYSRYAAQEPTLAGRVMVRFVVGNDGRVIEARAQPTTTHGAATRMDEIARCVQSAFYTFTFVAPTGGPAALSLPLDFGPTTP
jgi:hypothetical protein